MRNDRRRGLLDSAEPVEFVRCPQCGQIASVEWRRTVQGYAHLKIRCLDRHWFLMLDEDVGYEPIG